MSSTRTATGWQFLSHPPALNSLTPLLYYVVTEWRRGTYGETEREETEREETAKTPWRR